MKLLTELYQTQINHWPKTGRHILAQFDEQSIVVYQAYSPIIGHFAATHGYFGGEFSLNRMSWIKPNFLWMMYRSGWGRKEGQEVVLAIRLKRTAFDTILENAIHSSFEPKVFASKAEWQTALTQSSVRLQWDPDHDPSGKKLERRAIQLGLNDEILAQYAREWILEIEDISDFVKEQRQSNLFNSYAQLLTPREEVYPVANPSVSTKLRLSVFEATSDETNSAKIE